MNAIVTPQIQNVYVPWDFQGKLGARLSRVFTNDNGTYSFIFKIIQAGTHKNSSARTYLDFNNQKQLGYYEQLFEGYGVDLTERNIRALEGQRFELRFELYTYAGEQRQRIWINSIPGAVVPPVCATVDGRYYHFTFDSDAKLPISGKEGFKLWLALLRWSREQLQSGWPQQGRFEYPNPLSLKSN